MTRSLFRLPLAEICAVLGVLFGAWLIHNTFQPAGDTPNSVLLGIGALDILLCFGLLGYLLRVRLRDEESLPKSWIVAGTVLIACFLGWIAALFLDSDRLLAQQQHHNEYVQRLAKLEDSLRQFSDVIPAGNPVADATRRAEVVDRNAWQVNHDRYTRLHDQLHASLRSNPAWDKELARVDDEMQKMHKLFNLIRAESGAEQRLKWRNDFQLARERAVGHTEALREAIAQGERDLAVTHRAHWHAVGASALTSVVLLLGCLLFWLLFDRELRRSWKAQARLADDEARFRWLVENQAEPIAVLDSAANILYVNPAWKTAFGYELDELQHGNLLELIHEEDRPRIRSALQSNDVQYAIPCRLSADYGIWHDVEMQSQPYDKPSLALQACMAPNKPEAQAKDGAGIIRPFSRGGSVVRFHDVRETPDVPMHPQPELLPDAAEHLKAAEARLAELESECAALRDSEQRACDEARRHRWLLDSHRQANSEGVLILSTGAEVLSWNASFVRLWKLSDETMAGHTWLTIAAHMESQVASGWDDFRRAVAPDSPHTDNCWEMTLEGDRTFEVYAQPLRGDPSGNAGEAGASLALRVGVTASHQPEAQARAPVGAVQLQFRDVTRHKDLEKQVRDHDEQSREWQQRLNEHEEQQKSYETNLREHEKRVKLLEKQMCERDQHREELEATLRDHQDRLHQMHQAHECHEASLQTSKEATRRLASGVANDLNTVLSVVLGNTDVLRENLPKDHMAQNYVEEIRQAANRGTELSQRLLAFSRNHLLHMVPVEMNQQLAALDGKIRAALGHDVQMNWERGNEELWVKSDAHALEQALLHLVTQARGHMPQGGTLTIHASCLQLSRSELTHADMAPGAYIQLRLQDTGDGIDDETLAHVFEPYHPIKEGQKGDLTLATAYGILRQSGGCINVVSEKGKGCAWTILLPETTERPQPAAQETPPVRASA